MQYKITRIKNICSWYLFTYMKIFLMKHENIMELVVLSCNQSYHVYGEMWTVVMGKQLLCEWEVWNVDMPWWWRRILVSSLAIFLGNFPRSATCLFSERNYLARKLLATHSTDSIGYYLYLFMQANRFCVPIIDCTYFLRVLHAI